MKSSSYGYVVAISALILAGSNVFAASSAANSLDPVRSPAALDIQSSAQVVSPAIPEGFAEKGTNPGGRR